MQETSSTFDKFLVTKLAEEIKELTQDRNAQAASVGNLEKFVIESLAKEIGDFQEDRNDVVETKVRLASEFSGSYLNENKEIRELEAVLKVKDAELVESQAANAEKMQIIESKERQVEAITESVTRKETMDKLLSKLNKDKGAIMRDLLESVQTSKLQPAFERYLPAVLDGAAPKATKKVISESREVTGDKQTKTQPAVEELDDTNIIQLRQLAGLK